MEKTSCTLNYKHFYFVLIGLLMVLHSIDSHAQDAAPAAKEGNGLVIDNIQIFTHPAAYAPWKRVKENGVLYFMNSCTIRVVSKLRFAEKNSGMDDLRETIIVEKAGKQRLLVDKKALVDVTKPADPKNVLIYMGENSSETILHSEFPCFEERPGWIKPRANITLTVIVSSAGSTARKSVQFIYDELSH